MIAQTHEIKSPILCDASKDPMRLCRDDELKFISLGDCVTLRSLRESFTVKLCLITPTRLLGRVCNFLYAERQIERGDVIEFVRDNVFQTF